ncbi:MAG: helix-turn-helix domain-containing protein [bacterium]
MDLEQVTGENLMEDSTRFWLMEQIRSVLKKFRSDLDLTQAEVAEKLGKDQVFVSNCESGRRKIDPVELLGFLNVYEISLDELLSRLNPKEAVKRDYDPL